MDFTKTKNYNFFYYLFECVMELSKIVLILMCLLAKSVEISLEYFRGRNRKNYLHFADKYSLMTTIQMFCRHIH